jgi:hypothetical protein
LLLTTSESVLVPLKGDLGVLASEDAKLLGA